MIYFTSDLHFDHRNIIPFCGRGYSGIDEMNEDMIRVWNNTVSQGDTVYIVGDFCLSSKARSREIAERLNGQKHLILGNHDKNVAHPPFVWVGTYKEIKVPHPTHPETPQKIVLFHYAMRVWNASHYGSWQLYGHSHGNMRDDPRALQIDVGWDVWKRPISLPEVADIMSKKNWTPPFKGNIGLEHDSYHHAAFKEMKKPGVGGYHDGYSDEYYPEDHGENPAG